jgi:hypothetical protein
MTVRTEIPPTRKERVTNTGDAIQVVGGQRTAIVTYGGAASSALAIYVQCTELTVPPPLAGSADFRLMVSVDWGHGNASTLSDFDCTYRQRIPIVASSVEMFAWIAAFPAFSANPPRPIGSFYKGGLGGPNGPLQAPAGVRAKARVFIAEGSDAQRKYPTFWMTQQGVTSGVYVVGQGRLAGLKCWAIGAPTPAALYMQLFDSPDLPAIGDVPFDSTPLDLGPAGDSGPRIAFGQGQTRGFVAGLAWGLSTEPFSFDDTFVRARAFTTAEFEE